MAANAKRKVTSEKSKTPKKYGEGAQKAVKNEMHAFKQGKARSGKKGAKVTSREQAVAIGLSKARKAGTKVPKKPKP